MMAMVVARIVPVIIDDDWTGDDYRPLIVIVGPIIRSFISHRSPGFIAVVSAVAAVVAVMIAMGQER